MAAAGNSSTNLVHHHSTNQSGTALQILEASRSQSVNSLQVPESQRSQSTHSNQSICLSQSQRADLSTASSNWTSVSNIPGRASSLKQSLFPSSGFPGGRPDPAGYPTSGYPVYQQLQHSHGYPSDNFPFSPIPGTDLTSQTLYPTSEFPSGGEFPGECVQDDGSQPFIGSDVFGTGTDAFGSMYGGEGIADDSGNYPYDS